MKNLLILSVFLLNSVVFAIDPPKGLYWGMSYDQAKTMLELQKIKVKKLQNKQPKTLFSRDPLPKTISFAELGSVKLLDRESRGGFVFFHNGSTLCGLEYSFDWVNDEKTAAKTNIMRGRDDAWEHYQQLVLALTHKYGEPEYDDTIGRQDNFITPHTKLSALWVDENGATVKVTVTRQKRNAIFATLDQYFVVLEYKDRVFEETSKAEAQIGDEL